MKSFSYYLLYLSTLGTIKVVHEKTDYITPQLNVFVIKFYSFKVTQAVT